MKTPTNSMTGLLLRILTLRSTSLTSTGDSPISPDRWLNSPNNFGLLSFHSKILRKSLQVYFKIIFTFRQHVTSAIPPTHSLPRSSLLSQRSAGPLPSPHHCRRFRSRLRGDLRDHFSVLESVSGLRPEHLPPLQLGPALASAP